MAATGAESTSRCAVSSGASGRGSERSGSTKQNQVLLDIRVLQFSPLSVAANKNQLEVRALQFWRPHSLVAWIVV